MRVEPIVTRFLVLRAVAPLSSSIKEVRGEVRSAEEENALPIGASTGNSGRVQLSSLCPRPPPPPPLAERNTFRRLQEIHKPAVPRCTVPRAQLQQQQLLRCNVREAAIFNRCVAMIARVLEILRGGEDN